MTIIQVALPVPLPKSFDYALATTTAPAIGTRVLVPFGRGHSVGIVTGTTTTTDVPAEKLKAISRVLDDAPIFNGELLATLTWAARYYLHPIGEVLSTALPVALRAPRPLPDAGEPAVRLTDTGRSRVDRGNLRSGTRIAQLLERLTEGPTLAATLDGELPGWRSSAQSLRKRGEIDALSLPRISIPRRAIDGPPLNEAQQSAVDAISARHGRYASFLLDGVTGSGKTEVYLRLIVATIARGEQALVLLPEIALTPQMLRRFRERLGVEVAALHSGLADGERAAAWLAAARGDALVVLGTRSAVFTPLKRAGLIVIDEEHETSYKQQDGFRYHARDLAVVRARALNVPIVLGSATPSLESLANVETGRYSLLRLPARACSAKPPSLRVIDLRKQRHATGLSPLSVDAIRACLARGEQALIFRNRRGYAPSLQCGDCGWVSVCERCDRPYTLHRRERRLICHHCDARRPIPVACPDCSGPSLAPLGQGTQRLEENLGLLFPGTDIVRIDRDTTRNRGERDRLLDHLGDPGPRLLVGTQMLAKGHDLPLLTLVVVVSLDEGLYSTDFRASERLGQLLVQVAGRAGRAERPGAVLLQTHHPGHPLLASLISGGYHALAKALLDERRATQLPPFGHLVLLRAEAADNDHVQAFLGAALQASHHIAGSGDVSAHAMTAPMPRRAGSHRGQVLVEAVDRARLHTFLPDWLHAVRAIREVRKVRWSIDVDPIDLS
ncbi:MAG: primosomal protein N' [Dokdonella sp.]